MPYPLCPWSDRVHRRPAGVDATPSLQASGLTLVTGTPLARPQSRCNKEAISVPRDPRELTSDLGRDSYVLIFARQV